MAVALRAEGQGRQALWSEGATYVMLWGIRVCQCGRQRKGEAGEARASQKWVKEDLATQAKASGGELRARETGWLRRGELLRDMEVGSPTKDGRPWPRQWGLGCRCRGCSGGRPHGAWKFSVKRRWEHRGTCPQF